MTKTKQSYGKIFAALQVISRAVISFVTVKNSKIGMIEDAIGINCLIESITDTIEASMDDLTYSEHNTLVTILELAGSEFDDCLNRNDIRSIVYE
jgi:hypothetical protein